jgi:hypothetical protein
MVQCRCKTLGASVSSICIAQGHEQQQLRTPVPHVPPRPIQPQKQLAHLMVKKCLRNFSPVLWGCRYVDSNEQNASQDPRYPSHVGVDNEHTREAAKESKQGGAFPKILERRSEVWSGGNAQRKAGEVCDCVALEVKHGRDG